MSFLVDDDDILKIRPHGRKVRGGGRSGGGRRGSGLSGSLLNKWNFAEGSRAAVFKKIASGGTHTRQQLRRQMDYINTKAQYTFGYSAALTDETRQPESALSAIAECWEPGWGGTPKNGHTSHLLISFPPDTAPRDAAAIAEEMCERAFGGEKEFGDDRWEYLAALHTDRSHPHVHVLVNNRGVENGTWFYLSSQLDAPFTYQGFRNLMVSVAQEYGVHLEATTRYERGDLEYSPSTAQWRQGRGPGARALTDRVMGMLIDEADEWGEVAKAAKVVGNARVAEVADRMVQGIATQSPVSREEIDMVLETIEAPEEFADAITGWAGRMRDRVLNLPHDMQSKHFAAIGDFLGEMERDYGVVIEVEGIEHPGPIANSLHVDGDLLARRAEDYVPEGRAIDRATFATAVEMFSGGIKTDDDIYRFESGRSAARRAVTVAEIEQGVRDQFDGSPNEFTTFEPLVTSRKLVVRDPTSVASSALDLAEDRRAGRLDPVSDQRANALLADTMQDFEKHFRGADLNDDQRRQLAKLRMEYERADTVELSEPRLNDFKAALGAVETANGDYSFEARPGAVAAFWHKFGELLDNAGVDRRFAKGVFENDLLDDARKIEVLVSAVDPERTPKIPAEEMFHAVQDARVEMRANIMTPDSTYLASFMRRLTEREYPSSAPSFANPESEMEYAAALRAHFGGQGLTRMAEGDYRDLEVITPNRLHQRELAASVMAMAERPDHAEKLGLSREQIAAGYEAADEHHKARRVLGMSDAGDDFSL